MTCPTQRKHQLITFSNHISTMDDPWLNIINFPWFPVYSNGTTRLPWNIVAHNVLFTTPFKNWWFTHGRAVPIIRGKGTDQLGIKFLEQRQQNEKGFFMNVYTEGKVNMFLEKLDLKWGGAKFVLNAIKPEAFATEQTASLHARVYYHFGAEKIISPFRRPTKPYYLPDFTRRHPVLIAVGKPMDFNLLIRTMRKRRAKNPNLVDFKPREYSKEKVMGLYGHDLKGCEERQAIMDVIDNEMIDLRAAYLPEYEKLCEKYKPFKFLKDVISQYKENHTQK